MWEYCWRGRSWPSAVAGHSGIRSRRGESSGSRRPCSAVMYPLQSVKCHERDRKTKVGSAEGPRAKRVTRTVYSSAI